MCVWCLILHIRAWLYGWISACFSETKYCWFKLFVLVVFLSWNTACYAPQIDCKFNQFNWSEEQWKILVSILVQLSPFFLKNFDWSPCLAKCLSCRYSTSRTLLISKVNSGILSCFPREGRTWRLVCWTGNAQLLSEGSNELKGDHQNTWSLGSLREILCGCKSMFCRSSSFCVSLSNFH